MNILLIGMNFRYYDLKIKNAMQKTGNVVDYISDHSVRYSLIERFGSEKIRKLRWNYFQKKQLKRILHKKYDRVIVLVGRYLSEESLSKIKNNNPNAKFVLYLWDDIARVQNFNMSKKYFDHIYSFDTKDCEKYHFIHLPLFYTERNNHQENGAEKDKKIDIYSAMAVHSDRLQIATKIVEQAKQYKLHTKFYLSFPFFDYFKFVLKKHDTSYVKYILRPVSEQDNIMYMRSCKAMLDIQHKSQIGLTMRTIEAIGMGVKLITTNADIVKYDFYNENNICIIDRDNPVLDVEFLMRDSVSVPEDILKKYSLEHWVDVLISCKKENYLK
jgi:hypothetical protein